MKDKPELGALGKLAAIATALTAIVSFVFLIFPGIRPTGDGPPPAPPDSSTLLGEKLSPEGAQVIRGVLALHQAVEVKQESTFKPLDKEPPAPSASSDEQIAYLRALTGTYQEAERVSREYVTAMESIKLSATPAAFQEALQTHLAAWRDGVHMFTEASTLLIRAALDVQTRGSAAYMEAFSKLGELGSRATEVDHAMSKTWADVKAAALAVGIE